MKKQEVAFLKKSSAKDFFHFGLRCFKRPALKEQKFFAPLFFKKAASFS